LGLCIGLRGIMCLRRKSIQNSVGWFWKCFDWSDVCNDSDWLLVFEIMQYNKMILWSQTRRLGCSMHYKDTLCIILYHIMYHIIIKNICISHHRIMYHTITKHVYYRLEPIWGVLHISLPSYSTEGMAFPVHIWSSSSNNSRMRSFYEIYDLYLEHLTASFGLKGKHKITPYIV